MVPLSPSSCSLAQRFPPYIRLLVALFRGKDFLNGTPKNLRIGTPPAQSTKTAPRSSHRLIDPSSGTQSTELKLTPCRRMTDEA